MINNKLYGGFAHIVLLTLIPVVAISLYLVFSKSLQLPHTQQPNPTIAPTKLNEEYLEPYPTPIIIEENLKNDQWHEYTISSDLIRSAYLLQPSFKNTNNLDLKLDYIKEDPYGGFTLTLSSEEYNIWWAQGGGDGGTCEYPDIKRIDPENNWVFAIYEAPIVELDKGDRTWRLAKSTNPPHSEDEVTYIFCEKAEGKNDFGNLTNLGWIRVHTKDPSPSTTSKIRSFFESITYN